MVSKASVDFPLPLKPVIRVILFRGIKTLIFFKLFSLAPKIEMPSAEDFFNRLVCSLILNLF